MVRYQVIKVSAFYPCHDCRECPVGSQRPTWKGSIPVKNSSRRLGLAHFCHLQDKNILPNSIEVTLEYQEIEDEIL